METGSFVRMKKLFDAFEEMCKPYCQEMGLSVPAFEILMLIAKNEGSTTAKDICKRQNIKPTLMSFHIEKLVQAGYVERCDIDGDRRSIKLACTDAATPLIERGTELYKRYTELIWAGVADGERKQLAATLDKINRNAENIIKGGF